MYAKFLTWTHYLAVSTVIDGTITSSFLMEIYAINDHLTPSQSASVASHVLPFSPPFVRRVVVVSAWAGPACLSHIAANCRCNDFILIRCSHKSSSYQVIDRSIAQQQSIFTWKREEEEVDRFDRLEGILRCGLVKKCSKQ